MFKKLFAFTMLTLLFVVKLDGRKVSIYFYYFSNGEETANNITLDEENTIQDFKQAIIKKGFKPSGKLRPSLLEVFSGGKKVDDKQKLKNFALPSTLVIK